MEKSSLPFLYEDSKCSVKIFEFFFTQIGARIYIVTTFKAGLSAVRILVEAKRFCSSPKRPYTVCASESILINRCRGSFPPGGGGGVKRPGRKIDHSLPCSAEFKNGWNYILLTMYPFTEYIWSTKCFYL